MPGIAFLLASVVVAGCLPRIETREPPVETKALAPEFELQDTSGKTHKLSEMIANGPAVVIFYRGYW